MKTATLSLHEVEENGSYTSNIIHLSTDGLSENPFPAPQLFENIPTPLFQDIVEGDFCPLNEW